MDSTIPLDSTTLLTEPHPWTALPHRHHHPLVQYPMDSTSLAAPPLPVNKQAVRILLDFLTLNDFFVEGTKAIALGVNTRSDRTALCHLQAGALVHKHVLVRESPLSARTAKHND